MKKLFMPILAAAVLISSLLMPSAQAAFSDVDDNYEYQEAVNTLAGLNVVHGDEPDASGNVAFRPLDNITRAEFTTMLIGAMGFNVQQLVNTKFTDVSGHWAEPYITSAVSLEIVAGYDDNTFKPDEPVTYEQCLTILDRALGYSDEAVKRGGYPEGYINTGISLNNK